MKAIQTNRIILIFLCVCTILFAQENSVHLVRTITGDNQNKILGAKGIGDINGDGYSDFMVNCTGHTNIYYGNTTIDTKPVMTIKSNLVYPIGDVNKDGYDDIMIEEIDSTLYKAQPIFKIHKGGIQFDSNPIFEYKPPMDSYMGFSNKIENIGDINGDGYKDFIISLVNSYSIGSRVYVFLGGKIIAETPARIITEKNPLPRWNMGFGTAVIGIGDVNNDKYDDFLIYKDPKVEDSTKVYLYYGCKNLDTIHSRLFPGEGKAFGIETKNMGDINRDSRNDYMISSTEGTHIYYGEDNVKVIHTIFGYNGTGGDVNGDGYNDFLINPIKGTIYGFYGGSVLDTIPDFEIFEEQQSSEFGNSQFNTAIDIAGDINKDGYDEILITAPAYKKDDDAVGKVYIYTYGNVTSISNEENSNMPTVFEVSQNYPNPFNPITVISYTLTVNSTVTIKIFDILGRQISVISYLGVSPGHYSYILSSNDHNLCTGNYFVEFTALPTDSESKIFRKVIKTLLLK